MNPSEHKELFQKTRYLWLKNRVGLHSQQKQRRVVRQASRGMRVPLGTTLELAGRRTYALVVDRPLFDRELGAEIRCGMRVRDVARVPGGVRVAAAHRGKEEECFCRLLIGGSMC